VRLLDPLPAPAVQAPSQLDLAVVDLAAGALAGDRGEMERSLSEIESLHTREARKEAGRQGHPEMKGLVPLCIDLENSALDDHSEYRAAAKKLLRRRDLDPALKARLKQSVADDPLRLARRRNLDTWETLWARTFNAISEPLGRSLMSGVMMAPLALATSGAHYLAGLYERPPISLQDRQALTLRKRFLDRNPDAPETPKVTAKVLRAERKLVEAHVQRHLGTGWQALQGGRPRLAATSARQALLYSPNDEDAQKLLTTAGAWIDALWERRQHSLEASAEPSASRSEPVQQLLEALLSRPDASLLDELARRTRALRAADPDGRSADEAEFILALVQYELGHESASWERLRELSERAPASSNMARHAAALVEDPLQNSYRSFGSRQAHARQRLVGHHLLGQFAGGPRYRKLPPLLAYAIEAPAVARTLIMAPIRFLFPPWDPPRDFRRAAAIAGYRYLGRHPEGEHKREVMDWLFDYEKGRENWDAALRLAEFQPDVDPDQRAELVEQAARQRLAAADRTVRRDLRGSILQGVVLEYPDSDAGRDAGRRARSEVEMASSQRIRVTRGFLEENPRVAGLGGLGLSPILLDGDLRNGELHPVGVSFLGGRVLEFALVGESGDEEDPPTKIRQRISAERLARAVAMLDETARVNPQLDSDERFEVDASRDVFFERARLGLADEPDTRAAAQSTYVFRGLRERYGIVRARDSILPFDLVLQGDLGDFSLAAFPRWREPRRTPDAFLYE